MHIMGNTLFPVIFLSDGTHLSNFARDMKSCPVYITIGNLSSNIRQIPSTHRVVIVTLLPIPIKNCNSPYTQQDEQWQTKQEVLNEVLWRVLQPVIWEQNPGAESGYLNILCADGNIRRCTPVCAAWLADCPEYSDLNYLELNVCFRCECPKNELGGYAIWLSVPAYHDLTPKYKSYDEVSQLNGNEMEEMSLYLLGVVTQSLWGESPAHSPIFNHAIGCTRAWLELYMYARYKSHDDATLSYIEDSLHWFHPFKDIFLFGRAGKKANANANALRTELMKKRKVDDYSNCATSMASKKRCEMNASWDYISHEKKVSKELYANFNYPKIQLMSHLVEPIRR